MIKLCWFLDYCHIHFKNTSPKHLKLIIYLYNFYFILLDVTKEQKYKHMQMFMTLNPFHSQIW